MFALGQIVATPGSLELLSRLGLNPARFLQRHVTGDWGDLCAEDKEANTLALKEEARIFSSYKLNKTDKC